MNEYLGGVLISSGGIAIKFFAVIFIIAAVLYSITLILDLVCFVSGSAYRAKDFLKGCLK